ncbi:VOC family protein [Tatumella terrea]|uniref:VOC family protein n=1 Tax=Tatumella terrea TaxID=419007 RepID=A0ABW1VXG6_9GAMM
MFSHVVVGSDDLQLSKKFYDAIFRFTGIDDAGIDALNRPFYRKGDQRFIITLPINGQPATCANGGTIGFLLNSAEDVQAWHQAGVGSGGKSAESAPHLRKDGKFIAYLRDPYGNKLCAYAQQTL